MVLITRQVLLFNVNYQVRLVEGNAYQRSTLHWVNAHTYAWLTLVSIMHPLRLPQLYQLGRVEPSWDVPCSGNQAYKQLVYLFIRAQTNWQEAERIHWRFKKEEDKRQSTVTFDMLILNFPHAQPLVLHHIDYVHAAVSWIHNENQQNQRIEWLLHTKMNAEAVLVPHAVLFYIQRPSLRSNLSVFSASSYS